MNISILYPIISINLLNLLVVFCSKPNQQVTMIQELEPEEKNMVFKMVDTFLTKKKFKGFYQKNVVAL